MVFKLLNGLEQVDYSTFFKLAEDTKTRGHSLKLFKPTLVKNLNCRSQFFSQRVINDWNSLPRNVVNAKTVSQFKSELDSHWKKSKLGYGVLKADA